MDGRSVPVDGCRDCLALLELRAGTDDTADHDVPERGRGEAASVPARAFQAALYGEGHRLVVLARDVDRNVHGHFVRDRQAGLIAGLLGIAAGLLYGVLFRLALVKSRVAADVLFGVMSRSFLFGVPFALGFLYWRSGWHGYEHTSADPVTTAIFVGATLTAMRSRLETEYTHVTNGRAESQWGSHRAYSLRELIALIASAGFTVELAQPWTRDAHMVTFIGARR